MLDAHHLMMYNNNSLILWRNEMRKRMNFKKKRERMNFKRKLLEIIIQISLIPVSAFTTALMLSPLTLVFFILAIVGYYLELSILKWLKNYTPKEGIAYHVDPSYRIVEEGDSIKVKYDDGIRYSGSNSEIAVFFVALFALPLRIISNVY